MAKKGEGFNRAAGSIERREGVSKQAADAELASATRRDSAKAKAVNSNLSKVPAKKN